VAGRPTKKTIGDGHITQTKHDDSNHVQETFTPVSLKKKIVSHWPKENAPYFKVLKAIALFSNRKTEQKKRGENTNIMS